MKPTREGWVVLAALAIGAALAGFSDANLLAMLIAVCAAAVLLAIPFGRANVRGIEVARGLNADVYAGASARGRYVVRNRPPSPRVALVLAEAGVEPVAVDLVVDETTAPFSFLADKRGRVELGAITVRSTWPLGLFEHTITIEKAAELIVFPRPANARPRLDRSGEGSGSSRKNGDDPDDLSGLREYRPGDPLRSVHWPTTARIGEPMVVERSASGRDRVLVRLDRGDDLERAVERAAGEVVSGFLRGSPVGLDIDGEVWPARTGASWRRELLRALAVVT